VLKGEPDFEHMPESHVVPLEGQFRLQAALAGGPVPVPPVRWFEADQSWIGVQFFVMDRVEGVVAPDRPPYTLAGWVLRSSPETRRAIEQRAVEMLAAIHAVAIDRIREIVGPAVTAADELDRLRAFYEWARRGRRSQLVDDLFEWCGANLPQDESEPVLCWGDARLGNLLFDGTELVAVLDWDGAGLRAREFDLGWMLVFHDMFQEVADRFGAPGLPGMFPPDATITTYEKAAGATLRPLPFYLGFSALKLRSPPSEATASTCTGSMPTARSTACRPSPHDRADPQRRLRVATRSPPAATPRP
jgi:aminoglycoside phosphotransferase (APT) family kinase protein